MPRVKQTPEHVRNLFSPDEKRILKFNQSNSKNDKTSSSSSSISTSNSSEPVPKRKSTTKKPAVINKSRSSGKKTIVVRRFGKDEAINTKTLQEIRRLQRNVNLLIPRLPFSRVVREVVIEQSKNNIHYMQKSAILALQEAAEHYLVSAFGDCCLLANHAKRKTVFPQDLGLLMFLRGF